MCVLRNSHLVELPRRSMQRRAISEKLNDRTVVGISLESSFRLSLHQTGPFRPLTAESERAVNATGEAEHRHLGKARHLKRRSNSAERDEVSEETVTSAVNRPSQSLRESEDVSGMDRDSIRIVQHPNAVDGWFESGLVCSATDRDLSRRRIDAMTNVASALSREYLLDEDK